MFAGRTTLVGIPAAIANLRIRVHVLRVLHVLCTTSACEHVSTDVDSDDAVLSAIIVQVIYSESLPILNSVMSLLRESIWGPDFQSKLGPNTWWHIAGSVSSLQRAKRIRAFQEHTGFGVRLLHGFARVQAWLLGMEAAGLCEGPPCAHNFCVLSSQQKALLARVDNKAHYKPHTTAINIPRQ